MDCSLKLQIAWLTPSYRFSKIDGPRYTLPLLEEFQRAYPGVVFITTGDIAPSYRQSLNIRSRGKIAWKPLLPYASSRHYGRGFNRLSPIVILDLFKLKPDLVISHELNLWTILAALFKPFGKWKLLVLWTGSSQGVNLTDDPIRLFIRRIVAKYVDAFVTNSTQGQTYLICDLRASDDRVFRIVFKPGDPKALSKKPIVHQLMHEAPRPRFLYVGQLIPRKGVNYLLSAWAKLQAMSAKRGSLLIIGGGPQREDLIQQVGALSLHDVYFVGEVDYASLGSWYESSDVFVIPTLEDTWANVVPEAMAFGKPVLCSKYAGTDELVRDGENGFIFEPSNPDELARLMLRFINAPQLLERFSRQSKEIMKDLTVATAMENITHVIQHLFENKTRQ